MIIITTIKTMARAVKPHKFHTIGNCSKYLKKRDLATSAEKTKSLVYTRDKPHCNIGTLGDAGSGKTTLTAAISKVLAEKNLSKEKSMADIDFDPEEKKRGMTINNYHLEYFTEKRHYVHTDLPGNPDYIKNMVCGLSQVDGAVLVVSAVDGPSDRTREQLLIAKQIGVKQVVVFINKADNVDEETLSLVEVDIRDLLTGSGFDSKNTPLVVGSALSALESKDNALGKASILKVIDAIDSHIPVPIQNNNEPFLINIDGVYSVQDRGTAVTGRLRRGVLKKGMEAQVLGFNKEFKTTVTGTEMFHKVLEEALPGDRVDAFVRGIKRDDVKRGMALCAPDSCNSYDHCEVQIHLIAGNRSKGISNNSKPILFSTTWDCAAVVDLLGKEEVKPGENSSIAVKLIKPMVIEKNQKFLIHDGAHIIGTGSFTKLLPPLTHEEISKLAKGAKKQKK